MKKFKPLSKLRFKLAQPFTLKSTHPAGSTVSIASKIPTKKFGEIILPIPDSTTIFLSRAEDLILNAQQLESKIIKQSKYKKILSTEYRNLLIIKIQAIIFLVSAVESFVNIMLPNNATYLHSKLGQLDRNDIQKYLAISDKFSLITNGLSVKGDSVKWQRLNSLIELRNECIHFKDHLLTVDINFFANLFDLDLQSELNLIEDVIKTIKVDYLKE